MSLTDGALGVSPDPSSVFEILRSGEDVEGSLETPCLRVQGGLLSREEVVNFWASLGKASPLGEGEELGESLCGREWCRRRSHFRVRRSQQEALWEALGLKGSPEWGKGSGRLLGALGRSVELFPEGVLEELPGVLGLWGRIPRVSVGEGHSHPWGFCLDVLEGRSVLGMAARGSLKTLLATGMAMLQALDGKRVLYVSYSEQARDESALYALGWTGLPHWKEVVDWKRTRQGLTWFKGGGFLEWRVVSAKSVRGAHADVLYVDEADSVHPIHLATLEYAVSRKAQYVYLSTRNRPHGIVAKLEAAGDLQVHKWSYLEVTERCTRGSLEERSVFVDEKYRVEMEARQSFEEVKVFEGCESCSIVASCRGRLKKAEGFLSLEGVEKVFSRTRHDIPTWRSQYENAEPDSTGLVYPEFEGGNVGERKASHLPWYLGVDVGTAHPTAMVMVYRIPGSPRPSYYVRRVYRDRGGFEPKATEWLMRNWVKEFGLPRDVFIDPNTLTRSTVLQLGTRRFSLEKVENSHEKGLTHVRAVISGGRLLVDPCCLDLIEELQDYHYERSVDGSISGKVYKLGEDLCDALRYCLMGLERYDRGTLVDQAEVLEEVFDRGFLSGVIL